MNGGWLHEYAFTGRLFYFLFFFAKTVFYDFLKKKLLLEINFFMFLDLLISKLIFKK